jgi:aminopeptidase N
MLPLPAISMVPPHCLPACLSATRQEFYQANKDKPLTLLKWLVTQSSCAMPGNVSNVRKLMEHPAFQITNPNCCYSLFLGFARSINFHAADGSGYEFVGDAVLKVSPGGGGLWAKCCGGLLVASN